MPLVERRYAEALVGISSQAGLLDVYQQDLREIVELFTGQADFRFFILNPEVRKDIKKEVIGKILENNVRKEIVNFLMLLLDKDRIKFLPGILEEFIKLADRKRNILHMTVITSAPLEETQISRLKEKYGRMYNVASVNADIQIDRGLIGGIRIKIGDKLVDGSLKGRLEDLRKILVKS